MSLKTYLALPIAEQWRYLWVHGQFIAVVSDHLLKFELFLLDDFYVEVVSYKTEDVVINKIHFKDGESLAKYPSSEIKQNKKNHP